MKKVLLFFALLLGLNAQSQSVECGSPSFDDSGTSRDTPSCNYNAPNTEKYCMNVKFHIVRDDDFSNGFNPAQLGALVTLVNSYMNPHGITIINTGYDFINSTQYNTIDMSLGEQGALGAINASTTAIDCYLVKEILGSVGGLGGGTRLIVENNWALTGVTVHEFGHVFGLGHQDVNTPVCTGGENSSNCATCSDYVCDTNLTDTHNVMKHIYYGYENILTTGQGLRMRNRIKCNLTSRRSNVCATLTGVNRFCTTGTYVYTLNDAVPGSTVSWSVTPNLTVVSSNSTSITVQAATATTSGMATITANVSGTLVTKSVFVGKPSFNVVRDNVEYCEGSWHYLYIEIVNFDTTTPSTGYTYSFVTPPGITYTAMGNNHFRFRLPQNYVGYFELLATVTNSCGSSQSYTEQDVKLCGTFTYQYPRGVAQSGPTASSKRYTIFPNPADDSINIALVDPELHDSTRISAELYDMLGQTRGQVDIIDGQAVMDVSQLRQGIYVIRINVDGVVENHQIMIK